MVTYGDYFSRKVLHFCGIPSDKILLEKDEKSYTGMGRTEKLREKMQGIYQTLRGGFVGKNGSSAQGAFDDLGIERKILSAFYDSGILTNAERDYFQTQTAQTAQAVDEREQICVQEADFVSQTEKSSRVDAQAKSPVIRNIRQ